LAERSPADGSKSPPFVLKLVNVFIQNKRHLCHLANGWG